VFKVADPVVWVPAAGIGGYDGTTTIMHIVYYLRLFKRSTHLWHAIGLNDEGSSVKCIHKSFSWVIGKSKNSIVNH
jgi:hypothetical protein